MDLAKVRRDWNRLAETDPLWAVYVKPGTKGGRWREDEFFATGEQEIAGAMGHLAGLGVDPPRGRALDFGCGVGRLTRPLSGHFDEVVGVDISPRMIELAEAGNPAGERCRFVLNDRPDLGVFPDASFDLVYASLVLQHLPPDHARGYLREFGRVLRPGGVVICQIPVRPTRSVKGILFRLAPDALLRLGQRVLLRYPAPMAMHGMDPDTVAAVLGETGVRIVDAVGQNGYGGHWHDLRYFAVKQPAA